MEDPINTQSSGDSDCGADLVFRDVCVTVGRQKILHDVSGLARRGAIVAVMGPSGCGKSTLLSAIAGRLPRDSGSVTFDGKPIEKRTKRQIGYVIQEDVFHPELTLRETLTFTAMLRLPDAMPRHQKMAHIEQIVDAVDLRKCLDTVMGSLFIPGLSGGERKRANIACELLTNPRLLLLDEPTSGLDSAIACTLMTTLRQYAQSSHKTLLTTIHQPSSAIFRLFDNVLLLSDGRVAYFGKGSEIVEYFSGLGMNCHTNYNPADFILEKLKESPATRNSIVEAACALRSSEIWPEELRDTKRRALAASGEESSFVNYGYTNELFLGVKDFLGGATCEDAVVVYRPGDVQGLGYTKKDPDGVEISVLPRDYNPPSENIVDQFTDHSAPKWPTGFWTQYTTLTHRNFVVSRSRIFAKLNVIRTLFLAAIASALWWQNPRTEKTMWDRAGLLYFSVVYWAFVAITDAITTFPGERAVIIRERSSGAYRLSAYYCAKMTSELPLIVIQPLTYYVIVHWLSHMTPDVALFFAAAGIFMLATLASQSVGFFIGAVGAEVQSSVTVGSLYILFSTLAGGFYQRNTSPYLTWVRYTSIITYGYAGLMENEFSRPDFQCSSANVTSFPVCAAAGANETATIPGSAFVEGQNLYLPFWVNVVVLGGYVVVFRGLGYLVLRYFNTPSRAMDIRRPRKMKK